MTYDIALWRQLTPVADKESEFAKRFAASEAKELPDPPTPGMQAVIRDLDREFPAAKPWEDDLADAVDGDFLYLTMAPEDGSRVEAALHSIAAEHHLMIVSPAAIELPDDWVEPAVAPYAEIDDPDWGVAATRASAALLTSILGPPGNGSVRGLNAQVVLEEFLEEGRVGITLAGPDRDRLGQHIASNFDDTRIDIEYTDRSPESYY